MPDILKHPNGDIDYSKIFMGFAMAIILVMQQWQTMHIAELKARAEIRSDLFMDKSKVLLIAEDIQRRLKHLESKENK